MQVNDFDVTAARTPVCVRSLVITVCITKNVFCLSLSLFPQNIQSHTSKCAGEDVLLSPLQILYLSHLDLCQLDSPQPKPKEELLEGDIVCEPEVKEVPAELRKHGKSVGGIPAEAGASKHGSAKGRARFEDLMEDLIQEPCFTPEMITCIKQW